MSTQTIPNDAAAENGPRIRNKAWGNPDVVPPIKECCTSTLLIELHHLDQNCAVYEEAFYELLDRTDFYDLADKYRKEFRCAVHGGIGLSCGA